MSATAPRLPSEEGPAALIGKEALNDLLWQVAAFVHLIGEEALADTALTVASSSMLIVVLEEPGTTVADISRRIPKTQQTISQVVARLEKLGFIERRLGTGRGVGLHLTNAGQRMAKLAVEHESRLDTRLVELLGEKRSAALTDLLRESRAILQRAR